MLQKIGPGANTTKPTLLNWTSSQKWNLSNKDLRKTKIYSKKLRFIPISFYGILKGCIKTKNIVRKQTIDNTEAIEMGKYDDVDIICHMPGYLLTHANWIRSPQGKKQIKH